ncbi:MAG: signal peptidase II [candidate division WOR-3 bacterium]|nr:signal peptidase II [candidate division WOR-3 bacterium]
MKIKLSASIIILLITSILVFFLDQITKIFVSTYLTVHTPVRVLGDFGRLVLTYNKGIIFGIPVRSHIIYYVLPFAVVFIVIYFAIKNKTKFFSVAYGLILGGALGNLLDRIRLGYVIDFIDIGIKHLRWPTFNIADATLVIGLIMIIAKEVLQPKPQTTTTATKVLLTKNESQDDT